LAALADKDHNKKQQNELGPDIEPPISESPATTWASSGLLAHHVASVLTFNQSSHE